jgi:iron uptake system EfeUOB component EfeO/EfeM
MSSILKKITAEAKRIRKAHPGKAWKNAVKEAGAKYRKGTIKGVKKSGKVKKIVSADKYKLKHGYTTVKRKRVSGVKNAYDKIDKKETHITIAGIKKNASIILSEKLGKLSVRHHHAKTKSEKRKIAKDIRAVKSDLRKYC